MLRKRLDELSFGLQTAPSTRCPIEASLRADAYAMQELSRPESLAPMSNLCSLGEKSRSQPYGRKLVCMF